MGINTSTFGRKKYFGFSPRSFVFGIEQWSTPIKLRKTSLLDEARSTSAFRGQFIPVQLPPQRGPSPQQQGLGRGWGRFFLFYAFTGSAGGSWWPESRPHYLRYSDRHNRRDRVSSLLVSLLWKVGWSLPPHFEEVRKDTPHLQ